MKEKRKHIRYVFPLAVTLQSDGKTYRSAKSRTISRGGMCILLEEALDVGAGGTVSFSKTVNGQKLAFSSGFSVRWGMDNLNGTFTIGIEFLDIPKNRRTTLLKLIRALTAP